MDEIDGWTIWTRRSRSRRWTKPLGGAERWRRPLTRAGGCARLWPTPGAMWQRWTGDQPGAARAIRGAVFDGMKLSDALSGGWKLDDQRGLFNSAVRPVTDHVGGLIAGAGVGGLMSGLLPFEKGGTFAQGRVMPFANGGIVSGPVTFPDAWWHRADGRGGARGDHAAVARPDGKLGVQARAAGGRSTW